MKANKNRVAAVVCCLFFLQSAGCKSPEEEAISHLQKGKELFEKGEFDKALLELKTSNQSNSKLGETYYYLALLDEKNNNLKSMRQNLIRALELDSGMVSTRLKLGKLNVLFGDLDKALEQADAVVANEKGNKDALLLQASVYIRQGKRDQATQIVGEVLNSYPNDVEALSLRAALHYERGEVDAAMATVNKALELDNKNLPLRLYKIKLDSGRNDIDSVIKGYQELIKLYPETKGFKLSLASIYSMTDKLDAAEVLLREMVEQFKDSLDPEIVLIEFLNARKKDKVIEEYEAMLGRHGQDAKILLDLSKWMVASGYPDAAKKGLQQVIDLEKSSDVGLAAQTISAELALINKDYDTVQRTLDSVLGVNSEFMEANLLKARLLLAQNNTEQAIEFLNKLAWGKSNADEVYLLLGQVYLAKKDHKTADKNFKQALDANPANIGAFSRVYSNYLQAGQKETARQYLEKALAVKPNQVLLLTSKAELDIMEKRWDEAQEAVQRVALFSKEKAVPLYLQANVLQGKGRFAEAITLYDKLLQQFPNHLNSMINLVRSFDALKQREKAVSYLESHHAKNPTDLNSIGILSDLYIADKDFVKTKNLLTNQIKLTPKAVSIYLSLAKLEAMKGSNTNSAVKDIYSQGLTANPDDPQLMVALAGFYENTNEEEAAKSVYEDLLAKNPDNDLAANNLAYLLIKSDEQDEIKKGAELAKRFKDSDVPYFQDTYAWGLVKSGNNAEGLKLLEALILKEPKLPEIRYHLGVAHLNNGNKATAIVELKQAIALSEKSGRNFSGKDEAKKTLQQLTHSK